MSIIFNSRRIAGIRIGKRRFVGSAVQDGRTVFSRSEQRFFCYGNNRVYTSHDGIVWTCLRLKNVGKKSLTWIWNPVFGNGTGMAANASTLYMASDDNVDMSAWESIGNIPNFKPIFANGKFIAAGEGTSSGQVVATADGQSYEWYYKGHSGNFVAIAYSPGLDLYAYADYRFLNDKGDIVDGGYLYYTKTLGGTLTKATSTAHKFTSITAGTNKFIATFSNGKIIYTTSDSGGKSWTTSESISSNWDFSMFGDRFYAHCTEGLYASSNGNTWTKLSNAPDGILSLAYAGGVLVASTGGSSGGIWRSTDSGANWTKVVDAPNMFTQIQSIGVKE